MVHYFSRDQAMEAATEHVKSLLNKGAETGKSVNLTISSYSTGCNVNDTSSNEDDGRDFIYKNIPPVGSVVAIKIRKRDEDDADYEDEEYRVSKGSTTSQGWLRIYPADDDEEADAAAKVWRTLTAREMGIPEDKE